MNDREIFDRILDADNEVRVTYAVMAMGDSAKARADAAQYLPQRKARLFALLDSLTAEQCEAFTAYRKSLRD